MTEQTKNQLATKEEFKNQVVEYDPIHTSINEWKNKELPDVTTKKGYEQNYAIIRDGYRPIKKIIENVHKAVKADVLEKSRLIDGGKRKLLADLETTFNKFISARKEEDERLATIEREKEEAIVKRKTQITQNVENMKDMFVEAVGKTSKEIEEIQNKLESTLIDSISFDNYIEEAAAIRSALIGKLQTLYESTKFQEEEQIKFMQKEKELEEQRQQQRLEDEKRERERQEQAEVERCRLEEENAKIKAENERIKAEQEEVAAKQREAQRLIDEDAAKIEAEKKRLKEEEETKKREAQEHKDRLQREEDTKLAKEAQDKKDAEAKVKRDEEEKKRREEAEALAKKEAVKRKKALEANMAGFLLTNQPASFKLPSQCINDLINAIENNEIPYLRLNWCEK